MTVKVSTGARSQLMVTSPMRTIFNLGFLKIYAGAEPASADASLGSATLLCTISNNSTGTGLTFESTAPSGVLGKKSDETWSGVNVASNTAAFFRLVAPGDTGAASTSEARIQGRVATAGGDLNLSSLSLVSGATQPILNFNITLPTF